ncbi:MAG: type 1 glutamine amidotransferase [Candidatus Altiarchaeia archaeon]
MEILVLQHMACEGMEGMEKALDSRKIGYEYVPLYEGAQIPKDASDYAGIVVLGGPMNVYQEKEYPFLRDENTFIKKMLTEKKPMLGICLGGQMIAKAAGAKVLTGHRKELGWYDLELTKEGINDPVFKGFPKRFKAFQWHGDTFQIPQDAVKLAYSEIFPNQAYRLGNAYGLQFHIEVMEETINDWMAEYGEEMNSLDYIDADKIREDTKKYVDELYKLAGRFYENFISVLR